jgi:hypothetical protein
MTTEFFQHGWWRARRKYRYLGWAGFYKANRRYLLALERSAYSDVKQPEQEY